MAELTKEQDAAFDFEDAHTPDITRFENKRDRWCDKAMSCNNPDKTLELYKKAVSVCDEFKEFCYSIGFSGKCYYDMYQAEWKSIIEKDLKRYLETEYDDRKQEIAEEKMIKKLENDTKHAILKYIKLHSFLVQKDAPKIFDIKEKCDNIKFFKVNNTIIIKDCIEELLKCNAIIKEKDGRLNILKLPA